MNDVRQILGDLRRAGDGILEGWCWSPDAPGDRRVVDVVADDRTIATAVAETFRIDLVLPGIRDGHHAFRLDNVRIPVEATMLSLRDTRSGIVFARERLRDAPPADPRLERLDHAVARLRVSLNARPPRHARQDRLVAGFAAVGRRLSTQGLAAGHAAMQLVSTAFRPVEVATTTTAAQCHLVIIAADACEAAAMMRRLRRAVAQAGTRTIVLTQTTGRSMDLFRLAYPSVEIITTHSVGASFDAIAETYRDISHGRLICIDAAAMGAAPERVDLDPTVHDAAVSVNDAFAAATIRGVLDSTDDIGVRAGESALPGAFSAEIGILHETGGLDPVFADSLPLAIADLALRAAMLGHRIAACVPAARTIRWPNAPLPARAAFVQRWGYSP